MDSFPGSWTLDPHSVAGAFFSFDDYYPHWDITERFPMWDWGQRAVSEPDGWSSFTKLYDQMIRYWKIKRSPNPTLLPSKDVFRLYREASERFPRLHTLNLAALAVEDVPALRALFSLMGEIKVNKNGPSLMATSKFLHFWNPRLFVIVDEAGMEKVALRDEVVRGRLRRFQAAVERKTGRVPRTQDQIAIDRVPYSTVLLWSAQLVRNNTDIMGLFATYLAMRSRECRPSDSSRYAGFAGAAVEMFLLGWARSHLENGQKP